MDVTRPVTYRGLNLNDAAIAGSRENITGIAVEAMDYSAITGYGYTEKRSNSDGFDACDIFLGKRDVRLTGTIYGRSRADLFDRKAAMVAAFTPTLAYAESPIDYGYLPLVFEEPTLDTDNWPTGYIEKMMRVRARATPDYAITRDATGGITERGLAIPYRVEMEARDPRIYAATPQQFFFDANPSPIFLPNRGQYPSPFRVVWPSNGTAKEVLTLIGLDTSITLTIPALASPRTLYYDGVEKYCTLEVDGQESLRMDLLDFAQGTTHAEVPPGGDSIAWTHDGTINPAAYLLYWEAWA